MKQEAPWRPPTRTKCVDELMYLGLRGWEEEMEGEMSIREERERKWGEAELRVCVWGPMQVPGLGNFDDRDTDVILDVKGPDFDRALPTVAYCNPTSLI